MSYYIIAPWRDTLCCAQCATGISPAYHANTTILRAVFAAESLGALATPQAVDFLARQQATKLTGDDLGKTALGFSRCDEFISI